MMIFRNLFRNRLPATAEVAMVENSVQVETQASQSSVELSLSLPEKEAPPTPNNSPMGRSVSEGVSSNWDVKLDPRALTVDCSCGFNAFRRFRHRR